MKREAAENTTNAIIQATTVLYTTEKQTYFHEPVSRAIAVSVAIHGQYNSTKIRNASADAGVKSGCPVRGEGVVSLWPSVCCSTSSSPV